MKRNKIKNVLALIALSFVSVASSFAQNTDYKVHKYISNDGGILTSITPNGKWGIIQLGTTSGGGTATPKLYNVDTEEIIPVEYANRVFNVESVSNDGNVVVGSFLNRPAAYNRATGKMTIFPMRPLWQNGTLTHVTPDGKWAVGSYNGFNGAGESEEDMDHEFYYSPLFVNVETGDTIATPNLPKKDMAHLDQNAMAFNRITPDGRYIIGSMSWFIMQPNSAVTFVYDTQTKSYRVVGFTEHDNKDWEPVVPTLHHLEGTTISPDGHWLTGMAYITKAIEGSEFFSESGVPYLYDINTGAMNVYVDSELNIDGCVVNNNGTILANPNTGGPLRDFRIFFQNKYWITLGQIFKQHCGYTFSEKTGFDRTGTVVGVSDDASRLVSFVDPLSESYIIDFGKSIEEVCNDIDLLGNYSVSPVSGATFSQISTIEINFGRNVQVLGTGRNVHLYKEDGTKVADGLTAGNQGLSLKTGSKNTVAAVFRTRALEPGVKYYVSIDAGAIAVSNDETRTNKEIRINYVGRANTSVSLVKMVPAEGTSLRQIDATTSYILCSFDCPVKVTDNASAFLYRIEDGKEELAAQLVVAEGNTDETKNQVALYPTSTVYLFDQYDYRVVLSAGSISDYAGTEVSLNKEISATYKGAFVREVSVNNVLFEDDFNNMAESLVTWLRYEGDHNTPLASMMEFEFDADNQPWNLSIRDNESSEDRCAASHSLYSPSGQSDDWMLTPQIVMPSEGNITLQFDAQGYNPKKQDVLKVYVFEEDWVIAALNNEWMEDVKTKSVLLDEITVSPGANQDQIDGEWTHYSYDLSKWHGKNIYIAFANQNRNQSMVFLDNVKVEREQLFTIAFKNSDAVVNKDNIIISGQLTITTQNPISSIKLTLKDAEGREVSTVDWPSISGNLQGRSIPFEFSNPLPLAVGKVNKYTIDVKLGDKVTEYAGAISDLVFEPTKRVVLEEMTGIDCPNCPLGIIAIEKMEKVFGERFIPISLHTYTGDPYAGNLSSYAQFLGLSAAPSARINRVEGTYFPISSSNGTYIDTSVDDPHWFDIVTRELSKSTTADISINAVLSADGKTIDFYPSVRYAIDEPNSHVSLFIAILENGLINYQINAFGTIEQAILGEWGAGGIHSGETTNGYAYPVTHNDVVRSVIGNTMSGTLGVFPQSLEAGKTYSAKLSGAYPLVIEKPENASVVAMLIDTQSGEVINAAKTTLVTGAEALGIESAESSQTSDIYTVSGVRVRQSATQADIKSLPAGMYIINGKKIIVR